MAVIEPSRRRALLLMLGGAGLLAAGQQQSRAVREQIGHVASALSAGHPQEAMDAFDKSFPGYSQVRGYFEDLTDGYSIVNELDIADEEIANRQATVSVHWTLTLSDLVSGLSESREQDLSIKLNMKKYDWRIVDLTPVEFFNPANSVPGRKSK